MKGQEVEATPLLAGMGDATQVVRAALADVRAPPSPRSRRAVGRSFGSSWILIVAVLGGGGYLLVNSLTGGDDGGTLVVVPNLVGKNYDDAAAELGDLGLNVTKETRPVDSAVTAPGTVHRAGSSRPEASSRRTEPSS